MPEARSQRPQPLLLAIVGATASGKSSLAVKAARHLDGEIVNCDSMQLIRGLDIGTAKPTPEERQAVPHHLFDRIAPDEFYSAGQYMKEARKVCREISRRGHVPVVVGGTGLYLRALLEGLFPGPGKSERIRSRLQRIAEQKGDHFLHRLLQRKDPITAARLHPGDRIRVIRALEVYFLAGAPMSRIQPRRRPISGFAVVKVGLEIPRRQLYERINRRVEQMFKDGFAEEVRQLLEAGTPPDCKGFEALGYRHLVRHVRGELPLREAIELTCRDTRRYAKRQITWFRREEDLFWISGPGEAPAAAEQLFRFLSAAVGVATLEKSMKNPRGIRSG